MRTCEEPRPPNGQSPIALAAGQRSDPEPCSFFLTCYWGMGGCCSRWLTIGLLRSGLSGSNTAYKPWSLSVCSLTASEAFVVTGDDFEGSALCSEYGFAEKVVEGMFIVVNSITIKIHSKAFHASFELWQLQGYSVNPNWQQSDLRLTRITDPQRGEVKSHLMLPVITWAEVWHSCYPRPLR